MILGYDNLFATNLADDCGSLVLKATALTTARGQRTNLFSHRLGHQFSLDLMTATAKWWCSPPLSLSLYLTDSNLSVAFAPGEEKNLVS